jgi:hypothetical protein
MLGVAAILLALASSLAIQPAAAQRIDPNWSPPRTVFIPETGHTLDRLFLDLWREAGGANAYGYPITPEITLENGHIVQYLQFARFEYWPEGDANGNFVVLGNIGAELRPPIVFRSRGPFGGSSSEEASEAARIARAWLPLDARTASQSDHGRLSLRPGDRPQRSVRLQAPLGSDRRGRVPWQPADRGVHPRRRHLSGL